MTLKEKIKVIRSVKPKLGLEGKKAYLKMLKNKRFNKRKKQTMNIKININN